MFNDYDLCVANKVVNGKQQTVQFHVDDLMLNHADRKVNDKFLKWLNCEYGMHAEVTSTRGEEHKYLGMKFIFRESTFLLTSLGKQRRSQMNSQSSSRMTNPMR